MKTLKFVTVIALAALSTAAIAESKPEGRALAEIMFDSADSSSRGVIDMAQILEIKNDIFVSMDSDDNKIVARDEFLNWGFGYQQIAEKEGKVPEYNTAMKILFDLYDLDHDGGLTERELDRGFRADFQRTDLNDDGVLDKSEFLGGLSYLVAMRAALKPDS